MTTRTLAGNDTALQNRLASGEATLARDVTFSTAIPTASGNLRLTYFTATRSEIVNSVRLIEGATPAGATPTLVRVGIYTVAANGDITLVASTPNDTALLSGAAGTVVTKALSSPLLKVAGQRYAVGILVVTGATAPTVVGIGSNLPATELGMSPRLCAIIGSQTDLPASVVAGSLSNTTVMAYVALIP